MHVDNWSDLLIDGREKLTVRMLLTSHYFILAQSLISAQDETMAFDFIHKSNSE